MLQQQILSLVKKDQTMRSSGQWNSKVDKENTHILKKLIKQYGWLDKNLVGIKGADGVWLLAQHADHDIAFQKKCLALMEDKAKKELIPLRHIAYLTDRILVNEGKRQLFGTQFYVNKKGELMPRPIKDKNDLEKRRQIYGLEPFEQYKKRLTKRHQALGKNVKKK